MSPPEELWKIKVLFRHTAFYRDLDLLTPKCDAFTSVPQCIVDVRLVKMCKHSASYHVNNVSGHMHGWTGQKQYASGHTTLGRGIKIKKLAPGGNDSSCEPDWKVTHMSIFFQVQSHRTKTRTDIKNQDGSNSDIPLGHIFACPREPVGEVNLYFCVCQFSST